MRWIATVAVMLFATAALAAENKDTLPPGWTRMGAPSPKSHAAIAVDEQAPGGATVVRLAADDESSGISLRVVTLPIDKPGAPLVAEVLAKSAHPGQSLTVIFYTDPRDGKHWYVPREAALTSSWHRYRFTTSAPPGDEWTGRKLYLHVGLKKGDAEIAGPSLAVAAVAPPTEGAAPGAEASANGEDQQLRARHKNLLENPGFDVGGGGWYLESWPPKNPDAELPARISDSPQSGSAAIRLPGGGASLISALVPFSPGHDYVLSLSMRLAPGAAHTGQASRCFLLTPNWKITELDIKAEDLNGEWKRVSLNFKQPDQGHPHANSVYVRIDPTLSIDVDSVQLEEAAAASAYEPGIQVGLEPPGEGGILPTGKAELTAVFGLPGGTAKALSLSVRATAIGGEEIYNQTLELPAGADERRTLQLPVTHAREGVVVCQLRLSDAGTLLAKSEARYAVFNATDPKLYPPNTRVGLDTQPLHQTLAMLHASEEMARRLGLGFRRSFYELSPGTTPDPRLDWALRAFAEQNRVSKYNMIVIEPAPDSALNFGAMSKAGHAPTDAEVERDLPRFVAQFAETAHAFESVISRIELLNEPNIWTVKGEHAMPPARYMQLLTAIHPALRKAAPQTQLALNVNGIDCDYINAIGALGGLKLVDLVTVHAYRNTAENAPIVDDLVRLRAILDRYAPGLSIVNSEQYYGVLGRFHEGEYGRSYFADNETDHAGRTLQTMLHGFTAGAPYGALTPASAFYVPTPFGAPWFFQAAGGARAVAKLATDVLHGRNVPVHESVRALLFTRLNGTFFASVNARVYGEKGSMTRPAISSAFDVNGNALDGADLAVTYLPSYLTFPLGTTEEQAVKALQSAEWRGFSFPLELSAARTTDGAVLITAHNHERQELSATVRWTDATPGISVPKDVWTVKVPAGGDASVNFPAANLTWLTDAKLDFEATCGDAIDVGQLRVPVLLIPPLAGAAESWEPDAAAWLDLGEDRLSANFAPDRPHHGKEDLAARVALAWSSAGLHLLARVEDDAVVTGPHHGSDAYNFDSLQFYADQRASARSPRAANDSDDSAWILGRADDGSSLAWLDLAPGGRFVGANNTTTGPDPDVKSEWKRTATGWEIRTTFRPAALASVAFKAGTVLGLSILINDNDGKGRKQGLTLGPAGTEPFGKPWLWKRCQLSDAPKR